MPLVLNCDHPAYQLLHDAVETDDYQLLVRHPVAYDYLFDQLRYQLDTPQAQALIDLLAEQGTLEAFELIERVLTPEYDFDYEEFSWAVAKSGDVRVLRLWLEEEAVDLSEMLTELFASPHRAVIDLVAGHYPNELTVDQLCSSTPVLFEYYADHGLHLDAVVRDAYTALQGDRLKAVLLKAIEQEVYPPLDRAVMSDGDVVQAVVDHDCEQDEELIAEAFATVKTASAGAVLLATFPETELTTDDLINAMIHRVAPFIERIDRPDQLETVCTLDHSYWDSYESDLAWLLTLLFPQLEALEFKLTPTVVTAIATSADQELLRRLVNQFPLTLAPV